MIINENNFLLIAAKYYDNPSCNSIEEFENDLKTFQYIKKLFKKYKNGDDLNERLILNHIIVIFNLFGDLAPHLLFFKLQKYHDCLKPFLVFIDRMPEKIHYEDKIIHDSEIKMDMIVANTLRSLK
jgi:hypothetical protein